jgi:hypothetical protein
MKIKIIKDIQKQVYHRYLIHLSSDADQTPGSWIWIRDGKESGSGMEKNPDPGWKKIRIRKESGSGRD